jgi:hypothetical protein
MEIRCRIYIPYYGQDTEKKVEIPVAPTQPMIAYYVFNLDFLCSMQTQRETQQ